MFCRTVSFLPVVANRYQFVKLLLMLAENSLFHERTQLKFYYNHITMDSNFNILIKFNVPFKRKILISIHLRKIYISIYIYISKYIKVCVFV